MAKYSATLPDTLPYGIPAETQHVSVQGYFMYHGGFPYDHTFLIIKQ